MERKTVKRSTVIILGYICIILAIITVAIFVNGNKTDDYGVKIINEDELFSSDRKVDQADLKKVKSELRNIASEHYQIPDGEEIEASVRTASYSEDGSKLNFILDSESIKTSYNVIMDHDSGDDGYIALNCTDSSHAKYPEVFCVGSDNYSSIDANMSRLLPYYYTDRNDLDFSITHEAYSTNLDLFVESDCDIADEAKNFATEKTKELISSVGLDPEQVPIKTVFGECSVFESQKSGA